MSSNARTSDSKSMVFSTREITAIGLFTALIMVCSQLSIPLPGAVPMTLQTFIIPLAGIVLGKRNGTVATIAYLLLGAVGLPVFAGMKGGVGILLGLTGGFLLSFPFMAWFAGWGERKGGRVFLLTGLILGALINYAVGTLMFAALSGTTVSHALAVCVLPFIPTAILKIILVFFLGPVLRAYLLRAGVLEGA